MKNAFLTDELKDVALGSPRYFEVQRSLIRSKPLLRATYEEWYRKLLQAIDPRSQGPILELGSGGSYLKDVCVEVITSDVSEGVADRVIDARQLPFKDGELRAILATHAFHHIPDVERFLREAERTLTPGGVIGLVEVSHTPLARLLFGLLHPEPYDSHARSWDFTQNDSMADANQALSWIVFVRDRARFETTFPGLRIRKVEHLPWLGYLLSGGVTRRCLVPDGLLPLVQRAEALTRPLRALVGLHWLITVEKVG